MCVRRVRRKNPLLSLLPPPPRKNSTIEAETHGGTNPVGGETALSQFVGRRKSFCFSFYCRLGVRMNEAFSALSSTGEWAGLFAAVNGSDRLFSRFLRQRQGLPPGRWKRGANQFASVSLAGHLHWAAGHRNSLGRLHRKGSYACAPRQAATAGVHSIWNDLCLQMIRSDIGGYILRYQRM